MAAVAGQPRQVSVLGTDLGKNFCCGVLDYSFDRRALQHQTSNACLAWNCGDPAPKCQWQCTVWQSRLQAPMQEGVFVYHCIVKTILFTIALENYLLCHKQSCHLSQDQTEDLHRQSNLHYKATFVLFIFI